MIKFNKTYDYTAGVCEYIWNLIVLKVKAHAYIATFVLKRYKYCNEVSFLIFYLI